jgi:hypothetical protein
MHNQGSRGIFSWKQPFIEEEMIHPDQSHACWIDLKVPSCAEKAPLSDGGVHLKNWGGLFNKIFQNREKFEILGQTRDKIKKFLEIWTQLVKTNKMIYRCPGPYVSKNIMSEPFRNAS